VATPLLEVRQPGRRPLLVGVQGELEVGRDCDGLLLSDDEVSRRHAVFRAGDQGLEVEDLGSTNGTFVDGNRISAPTAIGPGAVVRLGATEVQPLGSTSAAPSRATVVGREAGAPRGTVASAPRTGDEVVVAPTATVSTEIRATSIERVAAAVADEVPEVENLVAGDGDTVTIVFSDIESSTQRAVALGDERWFAVLGAHNEIVRRRLKELGGREIKSQGDGFMLTFPSARRAVQCCIAIQKDLQEYADTHPDAGVRVRMGVHTGEAIVDEGGDLFGKHIIIAARIANLAVGGQVLASNLTAEITSSRGDLTFGELRPVELKGLDGTYQVCDVLWEGHAA
jgi:class 3 adenylate cyclase